MFYLFVFLIGLVLRRVSSPLTGRFLKKEDVRPEGQPADIKLKSIMMFISGVLYDLIFVAYGFGLKSIIYCLFSSSILILSEIDIKTRKIPSEINNFIFLLGLIRLIPDFSNSFDYISGAVIIGFVFSVLYITMRGIGGGDVKFMSASGLLLGADKIIYACLFACVLAVLIRGAKMILKGEGGTFAFGPYLAAGCMTAVLFPQLINSFRQLSFLIK